MFSPAHPDFDPLAVSWRLPHELVLLFHPVGEFTAVFNMESEDTHLLAPVAAGFLERLTNGEVLAGDALGAAAERFEQAGFNAGVVLRELHLLGLAEPFRP